MTEPFRRGVRPARSGTSAVLLASALGVLSPLAGCRKETASFPAGGLVVAEMPTVPSVPAAARPSLPGGALDDRYPAGTRVLLSGGPAGERGARVLSPGLAAAGEPAVSPDGRRVVFSGKASAGSKWQVYEASPAGGLPRPLTDEPGGASSPALLPDGTLVVVSPVPAAGDGWFPARPSALVAFAAGAPPRRLSFGSASVSDPSVLADGRILFVSAQPGSTPPRPALFAVNNDGTGVSAYAGQHDGRGEAATIRRPRELFDGRVAFVVAGAASADGEGRAEAVLSARPWKSRAALGDPALRVRSIEPSPDGGLLLAAFRAGAWSLERAGRDSAASPAPSAAAAPVPVRASSPGYTPIEAVLLAPRPRMPLGRLTTVDAKRTTGVLVCLDARRGDGARAGARVERVRILTTGPSGSRALGEVPLAADGSFAAEVPADVPLGIEALDAAGQVIRAFPPSIWVRPGESRGCIGCHEPHGTAPRNRRPLAVKSAPVRVGGAS